MKRIYNFIILISALLCLPACTNPSISTSKTNNVKIEVEFLFENDGIKVYRFYDGGRFIYYTDARGKTEWSNREGKAIRYYNVESVGN